MFLFVFKKNTKLYYKKKKVSIYSKKTTNDKTGTFQNTIENISIIELYINCFKKIVLVYQVIPAVFY